MVKIGDKIRVITKDENLEGIFMPSDDKKVVLKLNSGYNIVVDKNKIKKTEVIESYKEEKIVKEKDFTFNKNLKTISILHTGGTIASKVDYRTGAVSARFDPDELIQMFPELKNICNIKSKLIFQMFSEDIEPKHWSILAKEIEKEIKNKVDGIIITHGTDTMSYTSSALSFMLQGLNIPVILVGAQRSSDRGSSDAGLNLICAAQFITKSDFVGVGVCMHESMEDKTCLIHKSVKVRKLHTSRRDAFKSINSKPIARVDINGKIEFLSEYIKKVKKGNRKLEVKTGFENKVGILKTRPGMTNKELEFYKNYKGLIIEGTGLGHMPVDVVDQYTKEHKLILNSLKKLAKKIPIVMCSQCVFGRVNMNVYSSGRDILNAGVISGEDMLSETAFVKLGWLLGNYKDKNIVKMLMKENLVGEISERNSEEFLE